MGGYKVNTDFCRFYTSASGKYFENYLPDDLYYCVIDRYFNDRKLASVLENKCYFSVIFPEVKQPETIAKRINGYWFIKDSIVNENKAMQATSQTNAFIKIARGSSGGHGVYYIEKGEDICKIKEIIRSISQDIIIQKELLQSNTMSKLSSSSLNTLRVMSLLTQKGNVEIVSAVVRMGVNCSKVDNASSGGITCGVEESGKLKEVAFSAKGKKYFVHPDSKLRFNEITIPHYPTVLNMVRELHIRLPHFRLISWDIAFNENDDPVLIEANLNCGGINIHQLNNGPLFGDNTDSVMDEVFSKK